MQLALLPGLLLALAGMASGSTAADISPAAGYHAHQPGLYSVAAQAATTATVTTSAAQTVTSTGSITSTGSVTSTVEASFTPAPLPPPPSSGGNLRLNPLDWAFLTSAPPANGPALGPFGWIYTLIMLIVLAGAGYFYFVKRREWKRTNPVYRKATDRFAVPAMWAAGIGLLFAVFRLTRVDFLDLRFWLYLCMVALLGVAGWFAYWYTQRFPAEMAKYQKTQRARQYMPSAKKGSSKQAAVAARPGAAPGGPANSAGTAATASPTRRVNDTNARRRKRK